MNILMVFKYLKYKVVSRHKNGYGLHSPFIFHVVSGVFRNKTDAGVVSTIEKARKRFLSDRRIINSNDLGAGSKHLKTGKRKVADIAKYSAIPRKYGKLLTVLAAEYAGGYVLELGTSLGISSMYLAAGNPNTRVLTVEGCAETASLAEENFRMCGFDNISVTLGSFDKCLPGAFKSDVPGLIFIDGDHRKDALLRYFRIVRENALPSTVVIVDDIHMSEEMEEAWEEIKSSSKVSATIDIFRMGIVFFRKGLAKQNYTVMY